MAMRRNGAGLRVAAAAILAVAAGAVKADGVKAGWSGKGEVGAVVASGNTDSRTYNAKLGLVDIFDAWKLAFDLSALKASSSGVNTAQRYLADEQTNYKIDEHSFVFGGLDYQNDKFSGFLYQTAATGGYGYQFYDSKKIKLSLQVGAGYRRSKDDLGGESKSNAVGTAGMIYENAITDTTKVVDKFSLLSGSANTQLRNFLGLEVKISTELALNLGFDVQHNTRPPAPKKTTDELTTVNIVYAF